jgi:hypothetical protein
MFCDCDTILVMSEVLRSDLDARGTVEEFSVGSVQ